MRSKESQLSRNTTIPMPNQVETLAIAVMAKVTDPMFVQLEESMLCLRRGWRGI